jgi:hypothetical protein
VKKHELIVFLRYYQRTIEILKTKNEINGWKFHKMWIITP